MSADKDPAFWNALTRSRRLRSLPVGWSLIVLGVALGVVVGWYVRESAYTEREREDNNTANTLSLQGTVAFGVLAAVPFLAVGRRFLARDARDALRDDRGGVRPFVLYLRAFGADAGWHGWVTEAQLAGALRRVGVPVCVGRPGERLPPFGFHRIYFADEDWQGGVREMAARAACVVLLAGGTEGLKWEIEEVVARGLLAKTLLLVPARRHEEHRTRLRTQHGLDVPRLDEHYAPPVTPRSFDLCPVEFPDTTANPVVVVSRPLVLPYPANVLDSVFRAVVWVLTWVVPPLRRFRWLTDRTRSTVNYVLTLRPALERIHGTYRVRYWERFG